MLKSIYVLSSVSKRILPFDLCGIVWRIWKKAFKVPPEFHGSHLFETQKEVIPVNKVPWRCTWR